MVVSLLQQSQLPMTYEEIAEQIYKRNQTRSRRETLLQVRTILGLMRQPTNGAMYDDKVMKVVRGGVHYLWYGWD